MTKETLLMQYQSECLTALKSAVKIRKPFEKTFMDTMKLFMAIPNRINFLQLGRYGCFSEQTYRNLFKNEKFDWFAFKTSIISKHLTGRRKAIAIDSSYIPKSGHKTPWIGYFWSGCAGEYKRGLEIMGIGVIDVDNHECMTLGSIQTPDCKTLESRGKNLVDWYSGYLIKNKIRYRVYQERWLRMHSFPKRKLSKDTFPYPSGFRLTEEQISGNFTSLRTIPWMDARCWIITEPGSNWNFVLGTANSMPESPTVSLQTSENCIFTSMHRSLSSTLPKRLVKDWE